MFDKSFTRRGLARLTAGLTAAALPGTALAASPLPQLAPLRAASEDRTRAARIAAAAGRRVIGYTCETTPPELIFAAGFTPCRLSGRPGVLEAAQARYVYPNLTKGASWSDVNTRASEADASLCSMVLEGHYAFLDRVVISNTRKSIARMEAYLIEARRAHPGLPVPPSYLLDRAQTPYTVSRAFNLGRLAAFRDALGQWSGNPVTDNAIAAAIIQQNRVRAVLRQVRALRSEAAPRLSGTEALHLYAASQVMPAGRFLPLAERAIAAAAARPGRTGPRLFVGGSLHDHAGFYAAIEATGATIVADDHGWGDRLAQPDVAPSPRPLAALADHYEALAPFIYPVEAATARTRDAALAAQPHGAIFHVLAGDEIKVWEVPDERAALQQAGLPVLHLKRQSYATRTAPAVHQQIATFVAGLRDRTA